MNTRAEAVGAPLAAGAAAGLLGVTARAALVRITGGAGGDLLADLAFMAFLAAMTVDPEDRRLEKVTGPGAPLLLALSGVVLAVRGARPSFFDHPLGVAALITALCGVFIHLGFGARRLAGPAGVVPLMAGAAAGWLAGAVLLPFGGPFLLFTGVLVIDSLGAGLVPTRVAAVLLSAVLLAGAAWVDTPAGAARIGGDFPPTLLARVWYPDGPAEARTVRRRATRVTIGGGSTRWTQHRDPARRAPNRQSASVLLCRELASGGPVLSLGPASASALSGEGFGPVTALAGDRRVAWWWERFRPHGSSVSLVAQPPRRFLSRTGRRFTVVHYLEPAPVGALASGAVGRDPAYHLTVEALAAYLRLLDPGGFLVLEVPYSLRVVSMLKALEGGGIPPLQERLAVYGAPGDQPDLVVVSRERLTRTDLGRLDAALAGRKAYRTLYRPGMRHPANIFVRLTRTSRPRGYYASGTGEFTPATDDRPFFHQVQKLIPRTRARELVGLEPAQTVRFMGVVPAGDLPWVVVCLSCLGAWVTIFVGDRLERRRGAPAAWRPRSAGALLVLGASVGVFGKGAAMALLFSSAAPTVTGAVVMAALLGGLAGGVTLSSAWRPGRLGLWLMLPLTLLPLLPRFWTVAQRGPAGDAAMTFLLVAPLGLSAGLLLGEGLRGGRRGLGPGQCLALAALGGLAGGEAVVPIAQTFGLTFALLTGWVTALVAARTVARVSAAGEG